MPCNISGIDAGMKAGKTPWDHCDSRAPGSPGRRGGPGGPPNGPEKQGTKRMRTASALVGAALLTAASSAAFAQAHPTGFYVGGALGGTYLQDGNYSGGSIQNGAEYDIGGVGLVNLGYAYGNGLRTEIELGVRGNGVDKATGNGASG